MYIHACNACMYSNIQTLTLVHANTCTCTLTWETGLLGVDISQKLVLVVGRIDGVTGTGQSWWQCCCNMYGTEAGPPCDGWQQRWWWWWWRQRQQCMQHSGVICDSSRSGGDTAVMCTVVMCRSVILCTVATPTAVAVVLL